MGVLGTKRTSPHEARLWLKKLEDDAAERKRQECIAEREAMRRRTDEFGFPVRGR